MRVLHCIWTLGGGGAERQLAILAPALANRGHDIHLTYVFPGPYAAPLAGSRCTLHQIKARHKYDPGIVVRMLMLARRLQPDVIQTWMPQMDLFGGAAARLLRRPWVLSERSSALSYPPSIVNRLRIWSGQKVTAIVANSPGGAEYWNANGVDHSRIVIIPNALNIAEIEAAQPVEDARLDVDDEVIVFVGRLRHEKNLKTLVSAVALLVRRRPRVKLVLCGGDGGELASLEAQALRSGIASRMVFTGFTSNIGMWLKRGHVMAAVSLVEGQPNVVLEAIAVGLPVVAADIPAYRAVIDNGSGWLVPPLDENAIAAALEEALTDRDAATRRAAEARRRLQPLSADEVAARYEQVYCRVVSGEEPAPCHVRPTGL